MVLIDVYNCSSCKNDHINQKIKTDSLGREFFICEIVDKNKKLISNIVWLLREKEPEDYILGLA